MKDGEELLFVPYLPGEGAVYPTDSDHGEPRILGLTEDADRREFIIFLAPAGLRAQFPDISNFVAMRRTDKLAMEARMWEG